MDSDDDIEGNDKFKEIELKESPSHFPSVMYNVDGPNISPNEIVNIAPGEGQIPVCFTSKPNWEALAFSNTIPQEETTLMRNKKSQ